MNEDLDYTEDDENTKLQMSKIFSLQQKTYFNLISTNGFDIFEHAKLYSLIYHNISRYPLDTNTCGPNSNRICDISANPLFLPVDYKYTIDKRGILIIDKIKPTWKHTKLNNFDLVSNFDNIDSYPSYITDLAVVNRSYHALAFLYFTNDEMNEIFIAIESTTKPIQFCVADNKNDFIKIIKTRYQCVDFNVYENYSIFEFYNRPDKIIWSSEETPEELEETKKKYIKYKNKYLQLKLFYN